MKINELNEMYDLAQLQNKKYSLLSFWFFLCLGIQWSVHHEFFGMSAQNHQVVWVAFSGILFTWGPTDFFP